MICNNTNFYKWNGENILGNVPTYNTYNEMQNNKNNQNYT